MGIKPRSPGHTAIGISLPADLLTDIDERAAALGLNRSQYLCSLAKQDLEARGDLTLRETQVNYRRKSSSASAKGTEHKILEAIKKDHEKAKAALPVPPKATP